jgi:PIN domain nuclease of toxin-antitoxin system
VSRWVLDASALLALLNRERGAEELTQALAAGAIMGAVNLSEVVAKLADIGMPEAEIREALEPLGLDFVDFDAGDAFAAGLFRPTSRSVGLSPGDRACLALGRRTALPVITADQGWSNLVLDPRIEITMVR